MRVNAEQGHQTFGGIGRDHRCTYGNCPGPWHEGPNIDRDSGWRVLSDRTSDMGEEPAVIRATKEGSFLEKCKID